MIDRHSHEPPAESVQEGRFSAVTDSLGLNTLCKLTTVSKYPTSDFSEAKRWLGSAYFFGNALDAAKDRNFEAARFFGEQADKVMTGQATDVKCGFPAVPDVPDPSAPEKIDSSNLERWWEK